MYVYVCMFIRGQYIYGIEVAKRDLAHIFSIFKLFHFQRDTYVLYNFFLTGN